MSKLVILRGNSGSGKSTVALQIAKNSAAKIAIVDADMYRVNMLFPQPCVKEDLAALMLHNVSYCLEHGYTVIWDSIFYANDRNRAYLANFFASHPEDNYIFNFDVSLEETIRRHATRPKSGDFSGEEMKDWFHPVEALGYPFEYTISERHSIAESVAFIRSTTNI